MDAADPVSTRAAVTHAGALMDGLAPKAGLANHWPSCIVAFAGIGIGLYGLQRCQATSSCLTDSSQRLIAGLFVILIGTALLVARTLDATTWRARALWAARTVALASLGFWSFAFAVLLGEIQGGSTSVVPFFAAVIVCSAGAVITTRWTLLGGTLLLLGAILIPLGGLWVEEGARSVSPFAVGALLLGLVVVLGARAAQGAGPEPAFADWLLALVAVRRRARM